MKKTIKLLGIIALAAVIGLSMTGCSTDSGGGDPEYYTVLYQITGATRQTVDFNINEYTLANRPILDDVKDAPGSVLLIEKTGTKEEVSDTFEQMKVDYPNVKYHIPSGTSLEFWFNNTDKGAWQANWSAAVQNPNPTDFYFFYLGRTN